MAADSELVGRVRAMVDARIAKRPAVKMGLVTKVNATTPPTLTVAGQKMEYADTIDTPAVGDVVVFFPAVNFVTARRA